MDNDAAISALGALAQGTRLDAFRLLVRHEPEGLAAGEVAKASMCRRTRCRYISRRWPAPA